MIFLNLCILVVLSFNIRNLSFNTSMNLQIKFLLFRLASNPELAEEIENKIIEQLANK